MKGLIVLARAVLASRIAWGWDWLAGVLADAVAAGLGLVVLVTVFAHVPALDGWPREVVLAGWGFGEIGRGLAWMVGRGLQVVGPRYVVEGELDRVLLRPLSPVGQIMVENLHLGALPQVAWGVVAVGWAMGPATSGRWVAAAALGCTGALLIVGVLLGLAALAVRHPHRSGAASMLWQTGSWAAYPPSVLPAPLALAFFSVVPWSLVGFGPGAWMVAEHPPTWVAAQPLAAVTSLALGAWLWRRALVGYGSTGS